MNDICLAYGGVIAVVVAFLRRFPLIYRYPKAVAAVFAVVIAILPIAAGRDVSNIQQLLQCVLTQLAAAIATYELALKPLGWSAKPAPQD